MADGYNGVPGAFPYAFRASGSWLFRSYVLASALATALVALFIALGLIVLIARTAAVEGGSLTLSRAFYAVVGLFLVAPILAPTLLVARRHRRGESPAGGDRYDPGLALAGYLFLLALYVGLVIATPAAFRTPPEPFWFGIGGWRLALDVPRVAAVGGGQISFHLPRVGVTISALVPVVAFLYDLPAIAGFVPPVVAAALIVAAHRALG